MKIGIFGGSFNPVTKAHVMVAKQAVKLLGLDELIFVPAATSPFKKKQPASAPGKDRLAMLKLVQIPQSSISDFEIKRKGVSYTIDTLKYFKHKFAQAQLYLLIGSDQLPKLNKWKKIQEIIQLCQIVVFPRSKNFSKINLKKYHCQILNHVPILGSSTLARQGNFTVLAPLVNQYIGKNHLYLPEIMLAMLDHQRHKHSYAVANLAIKLAKQVNYDVEKARVAGLLHDITKSLPKSWHRNFLREQNFTQQLADFQLHAYSGYFWVKNIYGLADEEIAQAILRHTSLALKLTTLDKILYAADKLAEGRNYAGIQADRQLILQDFNQGFKNVVCKTHDFLKASRGPLSVEQQKIYDYICGDV